LVVGSIRIRRASTEISNALSILVTQWDAGNRRRGFEPVSLAKLIFVFTWATFVTAMSSGIAMGLHVRSNLTNVCPFAAYFAESQGAHLVILPHNQFAIIKPTNMDSRFRVTDTTQSYGERSLLSQVRKRI